MYWLVRYKTFHGRSTSFNFDLVTTLTFLPHLKAYTITQRSAKICTEKVIDTQTVKHSLLRQCCQ